MEVVGGVVGILENDVCTIAYAGFSIDGVAGVGVNAQTVAVDQSSSIFRQGLSSLAVDITVERVALVVGEPYVAGIYIGSQSLETVVCKTGREDLDGIDNPGVGHLQTGGNLADVAAVVPEIGSI